MRDKVRLSAFLMPALALLFLVIAADRTFAANPFGVVPPDGGSSPLNSPSGGMFQWIAAQQAWFYRLLIGELTEMKRNGSAAGILVGISFLYGVFHAAGPGHGKAVITSYLLVSRETIRKGIIIAFAAAFVQGLMAIIIVMVAVLVLGTTAMGVTRTANGLEIISFGIVAVMGAYLLWAKATGRGHLHCHACQTHPFPGARHDHTHSHAPEPRAFAGHLTFSRAWSAVLAVGIRPCSGAIIILVFAMSQQLYAAGLVSVMAMSLGTAIAVSALVLLTLLAKGAAVHYARSSSPTLERAIHFIELLAAVFIMLLGLALLGGAIAGP